MQRSLTIVLVLFVSLIYIGGNYWAAHWFYKWAVLLYILSFFISLQIGREISYWLTLPVFWTLHESLLVWAWHGHNRYVNFRPELIDELRVISSSSGMTFLLMVVFFVLLNKSLRKADFEVAFKWLCYSMCVSIIFFWCVYKLYGVVTIEDNPLLGKKFVLDKTAGPMGNLSMVGSLIAVTWPFAIKHAGKYWGWVLLPLPAVFMSDSSQPILIFCVVLFAVLWGKYKKTQGVYPFKDPTVIIGTVVVPLLLVSCGVYGIAGSQDSFFNPNGRLWAIQNGWEFMREFKWYLTGFGLNLSTSFIPIINNIEFTERGLTRHSEFGFWFWFHSDWFQLFFEMGIIGVIAYAGLFLRCLWGAIRMDYLLAGAVLGWGAMACFNFPVHQPVHALVGCTLVWMCLAKHRIRDMIH